MIHLPLIVSMVLMPAPSRGSGPPGARDVLLIDLEDPEPEGLELLPGISELEAAAIAEVAGPGPGDLGERLAGTGLPPERLREWVPYIALRGSQGSATRWTLHSSLRGEDGRIIGSRARVTLCGDHYRGSWIAAAGPERADLTGRFGAETPVCDLTVGTIACGFGEGDPWDDPIALLGGRSTTVPPTALQSREELGSTGIVLDRGGIGAIGAWRDRTGAPRFALLAGGSDRWTVFGGTAAPGRGIAVRLDVGTAILRCAGHAPRGLPPAITIDAARKGASRGRIRVAWSLGPREDGLQGRIGGTASGRVGSIRWTSSVTALGPGRAGRSPISGEFSLDRSRPGGSFSLAVAGHNGGASGRFQIGWAAHAPWDGLCHFESIADIKRQRDFRWRFRVTLVRGMLRAEIGSPPAGGVRLPGARQWRWTVSLEQTGEG